MYNEKLNKRENEVMNAVYKLSAGKERFLLSPCELMAILPAKRGFDEASLDGLLRGLALDGYFELIESERKGEPVYVVHMRETGLSYRRQDAQRLRSVVFRWGVAAVGAVITFLIGILLKSIFR